MKPLIPAAIPTLSGVIAAPQLPVEAATKLRITWHWTASSYAVTALHLSKYHFVLDKHGQAHAGVPLELNLVYRNHQRQPGYAAHVKGANSNNIAIAAAGMGDATESGARQGRYGKYPLTKAQIDGLIELAAQLCVLYSIPVTPARVLGHEEWDSILHFPQDRWDVNCIPHLDLRPSLNSNGTYGATNYLRRMTSLRAEELKSAKRPALARKREQAYQLLRELAKAFETAEVSGEGSLLLRQLSQLPEFAPFGETKLEAAPATH